MYTNKDIYERVHVRFKKMRIKPTQPYMSLEERIAQEMKWNKIQGVILASLSVAGILAVGAMAPNAASIIAKYAGKAMRISHRNQNIARAIKTLRERGHITIESGHYILTQRGRNELQKMLYRLDSNLPPTQRPRWDGKWRVVLFDITEKQRTQRNHLRAMLSSFGFKQLQKSVWVYPYPCEELISLLQIDLTLRKQLLYMIADALEGEEVLRAQFNLPQRGR